ncbi:hypothetical protein ISCGN_031207 [Ixodes scapularis]
MKPRHNFGPPLGFSKKGVDFSGLPIAFLSIANEPEIYLKAGRFSDHSWSQGDDGIPEKNFLEAHHTHEVIERKIVGLSSPLSSPEPFLPHVDATRFVLTRPSKVRRSSVSSGTGRRHQLNGEPVQGHQVSSTTTTTTRKSTTTIEEHSTSNTVHLLRLSSASLSGSTSACPAEDVPDQGVIRTHADRTSSEAEADEVADAPPPTTARRRSSVAVPEGSVGSGYHRRLSRASGAGDTAGTEAEADDKLGPSSAPRGAQRRLSLAEARRKSIAERGDLLAVPTPQQLRKLSFAESVRDGRDTPDIRLKEQPESGGPQDIEGESAQAKRRSRDESALSRTTNRDAGSEDKAEVEPDVTEPEVEPLVEPEVERETQESANQDKRLEDSNEVEAGAENQESALLSGVIDSGDAEGEPGLEPGDKLASEPENKVADESGVASVGNEVANAATGYDRKSKKKGDKGTRRSKYQGGTRVSGAKAGQGDTTSLAGMSRRATGRGGKDVVIEKAKVRLLPGRPSGQDSAAVRTEVEEIKEYVRGDRGHKRHLDSSRRSVGVVDTAKRVTESYRKSDTAKRLSKNEKLEVEVFVTELDGTTDLEAHKAEDGLYDPEQGIKESQESHEEAFANTNLTGLPSGQEPSTTEEASRTEEDSAYVDGTSTTTPSPAVSRADVISPKDIHESETADEGISVDEMPPTRDSNRDEEEASTDAASSSGRGSRGTVSEVPLVIHKPQIRTQKNDATAKYKVRRPKGLSLFPQRFKTSPKGAQKTGQSEVSRVTGMRRVRSDGETLDKTGGSRTVLTTPGSSEKGSSLLGRNSRSVNMEEQGLVESKAFETQLTSSCRPLFMSFACLSFFSGVLECRLKEQPESGGPQDIEGESAQAKRRSRDESALSRTTNRDAGSEDKAEVEPDVTEPEVEPLVEPEVERETQESANQDKRLEDSNEVEAGAENQESALLSGVIDSGDAEGEPGLEPGDKLASEPENKVADESGVASVGNEVANAATGYDRKSKKKGDKGTRRIARLQKKLDGLREERLFCEAKREDLLRRAKFLQNKTTSTRDQARDMWRRRYAEERKTTPKLEEECSRWRMELERLHRELLAKVEGELRVTGYPRLEQPSNKLSYKIVIAKIIQEIEDLKRRLDYTRISLGAEVRLRTHAEREVKNLREDLLKKKIQVTLTKKETQSVMAPFLRDSFYFVGPI